LWRTRKVRRLIFRKEQDKRITLRRNGGRIKKEGLDMILIKVKEGRVESVLSSVDAFVQVVYDDQEVVGPERTESFSTLTEKERELCNLMRVPRA